MSTTDTFEYFEGTQTIKHEDGSTTYITTEHVPYTEPLTPVQQVAVIGSLVAVAVGIVALPYAVDRLDEWSRHRREVRELKKAKKVQDLKDQTNN